MEVRTILKQWLEKQRELPLNLNLTADILFDFIQSLIDDNFIQEDNFIDYLEGLYSDEKIVEESQAHAPEDIDDVRASDRFVS